MGKSAPSAPDPYATAAAQYQYGTEAANYSKGLNDVNTVGPTGSVNYSSTPGKYDPQTGTYGPPTTTQTTTLSPAEQKILSGSQGAQTSALGLAPGLANEAASAVNAGTPSLAPINYNIDTSGVPGIAPTQNYYNYGQSTALAGEQAAMQPMQQQELEQTKAQLINSGNPPGSPAYEQAMSVLNAQLGQQNTQAAGAAITAGTGLQNTQYGEEANTNQQLFEEAAQKAGFTNSADQQALQNWAQQMGIPISEIGSVLGMSGVSGPSGVAPTSTNVSAPDIMSAFQNQYAGQLAGYNANTSTMNGLMGDAASLGALYMLS